ncbi:retrovirus-related pol polyprotein from transposon TNT 1-94 [Tanacetum coccineum]
MNSSEPCPSSTPTKVEVPKELPKVSMVNTSLKKLKNHLVGFDLVVKERTTATAITEGTWGFEHTKACFRDEIIPFVKALKDIFNKFDQDLIDELTEVQIVFNQMEQAERGLVITALNNDLRKLKGKALVDNVVTKHIIDPAMIKVDVEPIAPKLLNNRTTHSDYLRHTQEQAAILREVVEQGKSQNPLNNSFDSACKYTKRIQELLIIIRQTCPSINNTCDKLVVVTPKNKDKRVRFTELVTSSRDTNTKTDSSSNLVSNKPVLSSTEARPSTSASGSQPSGNTKKDKIQRPPSSNQKNKVEAHPRKVKSSLKNTNCVVKLNEYANVQHSKLNVNSELICVKCNGCMLSDNHDLCVLNVINDVNARAKSKSIIKSLTANNKEPSKSWGSTVSDVPSSSLDEYRSSKLFSVKFRNDQVAKLLGYGDYQIGNVMISRASKTKSWLWHRRLSHLNFGTINHLARHGLVRDGVVERRNRTLIEAARTMLIYVKAPLFLWAEAVATACYTQNRSIIRLRHGKTPYELLHDKLPDLSFIHVFGALCYPTNDSENLGKLQPKADIDFDEQIAMAFEHSSLEPVLHEMTHAIISSGLVPNPPPSTPFVPPLRTD